MIERGIYFRIRAKDYFLYVKKTTIDDRCMVVDCQEGIYKVLDNDFVRKFNRSTDELKEFGNLIFFYPYIFGVVLMATLFFYVFYAHMRKNPK